MAEAGSPVLRVDIEVGANRVDAELDQLAKKANEGVTFGGGGGRGPLGNEAANQQIRQATITMADVLRAGGPLGPRVGTAGASIGGMPVSGTVPFERDIERYNLGKYRREERLESRVEKYSQGLEMEARRDDARRTAAEDRNEARYTRSSDAASFAAYRQNERQAAREEDATNVRIVRDTGAYIRQRAFGHANRMQDEQDALQAARFNTPGYIPEPQRGLRAGMGSSAMPLSSASEEELETRNARAAAYSAGGGAGYGAAPGLYNRVFRGGGNFATRQLTYFQRFIAVEAIRSTVDVAEAYRSRNINTALAQGDPAAQASVELQFRDQIASTVPLGIGHLARWIRDPTGSDELSVRQPLMDAERANAMLSVRRGAGMEALGLSRAAGISGMPMGVGRQLAESNEIARRQADQVEVQAIERGDKEQAAHLARLASINTKYDVKQEDRAGVVWNVVNRGKVGDYETEIAAESSGFQTIQGRASARNAANLQNIQIANIFRQRDISAIASTEALGNVFTGAMGFRQAGQLAGMDIYSSRSMLHAQQQMERFQNEQANQEQDNAYAGLLTSNRFMAPFVRVSQMGQRALREGALTRSQDAATRTLERNLTVESINVRGETSQLQAGLSRDPDRSALDRRHTSMALAKEADKEIRRELMGRAEVQYSVDRQAIEDRRSAIGGNLALREEVSGLLAKAYGPGAANYRNRAAITGIAGGAELEAQSYLRADSTAAGVAQADAARRIGISQLGAYRAEYLQSFSTADRGGAYQLAVGDRASTIRPEVTLNAIRDGQDALRGHIGKSDVTAGGVGSVPTLLNDILQELRHGSGLRATD